MFYGLSKFIKKFLPKRLFYRALLIVAIPIIVAQVTISVVFFDSLWIKTNKGMTRALVGEIKTFIYAYENEEYDKKFLITLFQDHLDFNINPWEKKIFDLGDVALPYANNNEKCIEDITNFYKKISREKKPVVSIGGDHSITGGILQGLGANNLAMTKGKKISFLHIDAHTDTFSQLDHFMGAKKVLLTGEPILLNKVL